MYQIPDSGSSSRPGTKLALLSTCVRHFQRLSASSLKPWIAAEIQVVCTLHMHRGSLFTHCSCAVCCRGKYQDPENTSCTPVLCSWLPARNQTIEYAPILDINFTTPAAKRQSTSNEQGSGRSSNTSSNSSAQQTPSDAELKNLYGYFKVWEDCFCLLFQASEMTIFYDVREVSFLFH